METENSEVYKMIHEGAEVYVNGEPLGNGEVEYEVETPYEEAWYGEMGPSKPRPAKRTFKITVPEEPHPLRKGATTLIDKEKLKRAQEWADQASEIAQYSPTMPERAKAAAEVIKSLPDTIVDSEKLREWRDKHKGSISSNGLVDLEALLPAPPTPESASPRPEDVPVGEPWQVEVDGKAAIGCRNDPAANLPWTLVHQDKPWFDYPSDEDITLLHRLVPETTEQDDEQEFDPAYAYIDRAGDKWSYVAGGWRWGGYIVSRPRSTPPADYGPYTRIEDTK